MDVLDDILTVLGLKGVLYFRTDFTGPWGVAVPTYENAARFHLVVHGECFVSTENGRRVRLGAGDLGLIPRGQAHVLTDDYGRNAAPLETVLKTAGFAGEGALILGDGDRNAATQMVCGHFAFRAGADHALLRALPDLLVITAADRAEHPWLDDVLRLVVRRVFDGGLGSTGAASRMSEIVFIELLRASVDIEPGLRPIVESFRDEKIGAALKLIHDEPATQWSVAKLASAVGMSRSRFSDRFSELLGIGPMGYLAEWRLQKALSLLQETSLPIQQIAQKTGYLSAAAFSRAFAGRFGDTPSSQRRAA